MHDAGIEDPAAGEVLRRVPELLRHVGRHVLDRPALLGLPVEHHRGTAHEEPALGAQRLLGPGAQLVRLEGTEREAEVGGELAQERHDLAVEHPGLARVDREHAEHASVRANREGRAGAESALLRRFPPRREARVGLGVVHDDRAVLDDRAGRGPQLGRGCVEPDLQLVDVARLEPGGPYRPHGAARPVDQAGPHHGEPAVLDADPADLREEAVAALLPHDDLVHLRDRAVEPAEELDALDGVPLPDELLQLGRDLLDLEDVVLVVLRGLVPHAEDDPDDAPLDDRHAHEPPQRRVTRRQALLVGRGGEVVVDHGAGRAARSRPSCRPSRSGSASRTPPSSSRAPPRSRSSG